MAAMKYKGGTGTEVAVPSSDPESDWTIDTDEDTQTRISLYGNSLSPAHIMSGMETIVPADMVRSMRVVTITKTTYKRKKKQS